MNWFKRCIKSMSRNRKRSLLFFLIAFVVGLVFSLSLNLSQGINDIETRARNDLGRVFLIAQDYEYYDNLTPDEQESLKRPSIDDYTLLGELPYIEKYDLRVTTNIKAKDIEPYVSSLIELENYTFESDGQLSLLGTSYPRTLEMDEGVITLLSGRTFTEEEIEKGSPVLLIHRALAEKNNLEVGDALLIEAQDVEEHTEEFPASIIGIYEETEKLDEELPKKNEDSRLASEIESLYNTIISPSSYSEKISEFRYGGLRGFDKADLGEPYYVLKEAKARDAFLKETRHILPPSYKAVGTSDVFEEVAAPLKQLSTLSHYILLLGFLAGISILTVYTLMMYKDRTEEIGILYSLGEKKAKIIIQMICEVLMISFIALLLSFVVGTIVGGILTESLIELRMDEDVEEAYSPDYSSSFGYLKEDFSKDEVLGYYRSQFRIRDFLIYFGISLWVLLLSSILPMIYLLKLKPRELLL